MRKRWSLFLIALLACGDQSFDSLPANDAGATDGSSSEGGAITDGGAPADAARDASSCGTLPCGATLFGNTQSFAPTELVANSARVFWTESDGTTSLVESCPIPGCGGPTDYIQHQTTLDTFGGLGADDSGVAFTLNSGNRVIACASTAPGCIPDRLTASTHPSPLGVAFTDEDHVVEGSSTGVNIHFDGGAAGFTDGPVSLVVVSASDVYYVLEPAASNYVITHAPLTNGVFASAPITLAEAGSTAPLGLAVQGNVVAWVDGTSTVHFVVVGSSAQTNVPLASDATLQRVATDGVKIYATDDSGRVLRCDLPGCSNVTSIVTGAAHPRGIAVDATSVYFADRGGANGRILRAAK